MLVLPCWDKGALYDGSEGGALIYVRFRRACLSARPETAASQPHTDYSRVDRVESVAPLDAKRPYSTLMFSRKENASCINAV